MTPEQHRNDNSFRTISENEFGYVGLCDCCRTVNVAFHNSLFCLTLEQFGPFVELMHDRLTMQPCCTGHSKQWMLPTPMTNYFLLFSDAELASLSALLNEAAPVLEAERILGASRHPG